MNLPCKAVLVTSDPALSRKVRAYTRETMDLCEVPGLRELEQETQGLEGLLILADLRVPDYAKVLDGVRKTDPNRLAIGFAVPETEPERLAAEAGLYAVISPECERKDFQGLLARARAHLNLMQECALARSAVARAPESSSSPSPHAPGPAADSVSLRAFSAALRNFDQLDVLCQQVVEGVASVTRVSRAGLFYRAHAGESFSLKAGTRCLERTHSLRFAEDHPLVAWLDTHAHMISHLTLEHVQSPADRLMLKQAMDLFGAEVLIPLHLRRRFAGWLLLGHHITGRPFSHAELEELMSVTEHVTVVLENARLYEEVSVRKSLAETLFHTLPIGIVAVGEAGNILWFNRSAETILRLPGASLVGRSADALGSRLADCLYRTLNGQEILTPEMWDLHPGRRTLSVETRRLKNLNVGVGAVALVEDVTNQIVLKERQEQLARYAYWAEMVEKLSHEVRNAMTPIKTFAQLLPDKYADTAFRNEYSQVMNTEVDRLDHIVQQMNDFANLPKPTLVPLDIREPILRGQNDAKLRVPASNCPITVSIPQNPPRILGDLNALSNCFVHLFTNAMEAMNGQSSPQIHVRVDTVSDVAGAPTHLKVKVSDNGGGIPREILPTIFSPFCTKKNGSLGLGLAIAQRTVLDHHGEIDVDSTPQKGTAVTLVLPVVAPTPEM